MGLRPVARAPRIQRRTRVSPDLLNSCRSWTAAARSIRVEADDALREVDRHAILAQELVADDATQLEAEEGARSLEVEHDHRDLREADRLEREIHVREQEGVHVPPGRPVDLERNAAERIGCRDEAG